MEGCARRAFAIVEDFERAVAEYTGAPYAVAVDSCTNAVFLALLWDVPRLRLNGGVPGAQPTLTLPRRTYVGVARSVMNVGCRIAWRSGDWEGRYRIGPTHVVDAAKRFTRGMYSPGDLMCVSFQAYKILPIGRGGAILTDDSQAVEWLRRARFDGRDPQGEDTGHSVGYHAYMTPPDAARGLWLMEGLADDNADLPNDHVDISAYSFRAASIAAE